MNNKNIAASFAIAVLAISAIPGLASAHGSRDNRDNNRQVRIGAETELGIKIFDDQKSEDRGLHIGQPGLFYKGQVSAVSSNGFTATVNGESNIFVDTNNAKLIRVPRTPIVLSNISVNDKVWITGSKSGSTITASVVYEMEQNVHTATGTGTVTAVNGNNITVQTKNNTAVNVKTDADTRITNKNGEVVTTAQIQTGSKIKLWGLWNEITKVFSAITIKIK